VELARTVNALAADIGVVPVSFYAVSCKANRDLCKYFGMEGFPQLKIYKAGATAVTADLRFAELHPMLILNSLGVQLDQLKLAEELLNITKEESSVETAVRSVRSFFRPPQDDSGPQSLSFKRSKKDVFDDAYASLVFFLKNEVYTSEGRLPPEKREALQRWLLFLQRVLPSAWNVRRIVEGILTDFKSACTQESGLLKIIENTISPSAPLSWSPACTKGEEGMGYTCGLWQLFHIASVGLVEWNRFLPDDTNLRMAISAEDAGKILRDTVNSFFGCQECRTNFVKAYDDCFLDRCNRLRHFKDIDHWQQFPTWLLDMHNAVNVRLAKEKAEKDHHILTLADENAKKWPQQQDCPKCWKKDGAIDEEAMYKYLRIEYW
jgi:hypothetical protein